MSAIPNWQNNSTSADKLSSTSSWVEPGSTSPDIPPLFAHQQEALDFLLKTPKAYVASDPGTGKSRVILELAKQTKLKTLVLGPKSILRCSWEADAHRFTPELRTSVAFAENRIKAMSAEADIYFVNVDAATWLIKNPKFLEKFNEGMLVIDEATSVKNPSAQRSKAVQKIAKLFSRRVLLSGTPAPNTVLDLHHQYLIIDDGQHLGSSWWSFRQTCCTPVQTGPGASMVKWVDKPHIHEAVGDLIADITIRHELESVIDMPPRVLTELSVDMSPTIYNAYQKLRDESLLLIENKIVTALNAATLVQKLLQCLSGAIYDENGHVAILDNSRTELVLDLVEQRKHSVVAFQWKHQREQLEAEAKARKLSYAFIDGTVPAEQRGKIVDQYQAGELRVIFAQPQSTAHGITLVKGTATIWASPTYSSELYTQFSHRIYRAGQTQRTETIHISAAGTQEEKVYQALTNKLDAQQTLLSLLGGTND